MQTIPDVKDRRALVCAPFGRDGELIARVLQQRYTEAIVCESIASLSVAMDEGCGAILVADEALEQSGLRLLSSRLEAQPSWSDIPVFVMTGGVAGTSAQERVRQLQSLGNVTFLERPLRIETIASVFRMALRARAHQYQLRDQLAAAAKAAKALEESENYYRTLAEALPQLVWTSKSDGQCDYLSQQWVRYTGIPEEEQLGLRWIDLVMHPEDRERTFRAWMTAVGDRAPYDLEYRLRRHDGVYRWFKTRGTPVRSADGSIQRWFGTCTDIEDERRASEERMALLASEQEARNIAEMLNRIAPALIEELDTNRLAQKAIDLATMVTGAQFGALLFRDSESAQPSNILRAFSGVAPSVLAALTPEQEYLRLATGSNEADPFALLFGNLLAVKSYLSAPIISRSGERLGLLLFGRANREDFTDQQERLVEGLAAQTAIALDNARLFALAQRSQDALVRSNAELRLVNEDLNQFAYSASHDLREPLRMVAIYCQLLQRDYGEKLDAQASQYLQFSIEGAQRMDRLLRDLLAYTQAVGAGLNELTPVNADQVLDHAIGNLISVVRDTGAVIQSCPLPQLMVSEVHLLQIFQNLVGNALKYRGPDPPRIQIVAAEMGSQGSGEMWKVTVQDNGIGIEPEYAKQVFGIFKRLHSGRDKYDGTGIGLAICQRIVERYGGAIWVESAGADQGCAFHFTLPGLRAS